jgi:hypothetical protein
MRMTYLIRKAVIRFRIEEKAKKTKEGGAEE